jgi:tRNA(Ile2) C34 agmatinyltransferase TiaS
METFVCVNCAELKPKAEETKLSLPIRIGVSFLSRRPRWKNPVCYSCRKTMMLTGWTGFVVTTCVTALLIFAFVMWMNT